MVHSGAHTGTRHGRTLRQPALWLGLSLAGLCALPVAVAAQEGGPVWRLTLSQSVQTESNPGLDRPEAPRETTARTGLALSFSDATPSQSLEFAATGSLVFGDEDGADTLQDPQLTFGYSRSAANAALDLSLFARKRDVDALAFDLGLDAAGSPVVIARADTGTQRQTGGRLTYTWGTAGPVELRVGVNQTDTRYSNTTDPDLVDSTRTGFQGSVKMDLSPVTALTLSASTSTLDEVGVAADSVTDTYGITLSNARPDGTLSFGLTSTRSDDGTRTGASVSRSFELASGTLGLTAGAERSAFGETGFNGGLTWQQERPNGSLEVGLTHGLSQDSRDNEIRRTRLTVDLQEALRPRLTGTLGLSYLDSEDTVSRESTTATRVSAGLSYALTEDWGLSANASHQIEDEDGLSSVDNTVFSLSIRRTFEFRP